MIEQLDTSPVHEDNDSDSSKLILCDPGSQWTVVVSSACCFADTISLASGTQPGTKRLKFRLFFCMWRLSSYM